MSHVELLKEHGLKATPQRLCVLKILDRHVHPTIDQLFEEIKKDYPSISLATVYKNLNTLILEGIAVEINSPNQKARFDIYEIPHIHVVCENCGHIVDIGMNDTILPECKDGIEKRINGAVKRLNLVATVSECSHCK